ncbi:protein MICRORCHIDIA 7 [Citrus sinensis]|uniref:Protein MICRORCHIDIA 7 n=1 Tax=Citrus sinensis TaxID=2711 RepID=A0ACB8LLI8_CITSI|nr:protein MICRORCHIDIA 7 [Citrus sinensis]
MKAKNSSATTNEICSSGGGGSTSSSSSSDDSDVDMSFLDNIGELVLNKKRNSNEFENGYLFGKKQKTESFEFGVVSPPEFSNCILAPLPLNFVPLGAEPISSFPSVANDDASKKSEEAEPVLRACKQFWKAGDYEGGNAGDSLSYSVGMDHLRVHPKFLHSNATSHKWALGAFAELLDNSLDEVCNGATYVQVDLLKNKTDGTHMLLVEDNGGGMTPDKMRQCMSLGYSAKSKLANTIGQYGNGFKTSTMRLGADVIVFSRCQGTDGKCSTQSIGMLSYTFLRGTGKEDIVVPMVDYEKRGEHWDMLVRSSPEDWSRNLETIVQWSPYTSEEDLTQQFNFMEDQGTHIVIYNLWEDDEGKLEMDFDSDPHSYASILYLRLPPGFRIILRGQDVEHHNIVNDMMLIKELRYKPTSLPERVPRDLNMAANVTIGFVKDAHYHIDIQGFNVYHKNRLIKPFWRVWNAAGSDGRGAIGVLEANFVEPAHDKQGFERTPVLARLEARLVAIQKEYWCTNCHEVGYAPRRHSKTPVSSKKESKTSDKDKSNNLIKDYKKNLQVKTSCHEASPAIDESQRGPGSHGSSPHGTRNLLSKAAGVNGNRPVLSTSHTESLMKSNEKNHESSERIEKREEGPTKQELSKDLQYERDRCRMLEKQLKTERDRCKSLESQLKEVENKLRELEKKEKVLIDDNASLINIFQEELKRSDAKVERLRERLREASNINGELLEKVKQLEGGSV